MTVFSSFFLSLGFQASLEVEQSAWEGTPGALRGGCHQQSSFYPKPLCACARACLLGNMGLSQKIQTALQGPCSTRLRAEVATGPCANTRSIQFSGSSEGPLVVAEVDRTDPSHIPYKRNLEKIDKLDYTKI